MNDSQNEVTTNDESTASKPADTPKVKKERKPTAKLPKVLFDAANTSLAALNRALATRHKVEPMKDKLFRDWVRRNHGYISGKHGASSKLDASKTAFVKSADAMYAERSKRSKA